MGGIKFLIGIGAVWLTMTFYAMESPSQEAMHLEKIAHFHNQGEVVATLYEKAIFSKADVPDDHYVFMRKHTEILDEIKRELEASEQELNEQTLIDYVHFYCRSFENKIDQTRLSQLLSSCRRDRAKCISGADKIYIDHKMQTCEQFYALILKLALVRTRLGLEAIIRSHEERGISQRDTLAHLLGYYFEFGKVYAKDFMPTLLIVSRDTFRTKRIKAEFARTCEKMFDDLDAYPNASKRYLWAWMCLHAFGSGIIDAFTITNLKKHFADLKPQSSALYEAQLKIFYTFGNSYGGPVGAKAIVREYKRDIAALTKDANHK